MKDRYQVKVWHKRTRTRQDDLEFKTSFKIEALKHAKQVSRNVQAGCYEVEVLDTKPFELDGETYSQKTIWSNERN